MTLYSMTLYGIVIRGRRFFPSIFADFALAKDRSYAKER
jgi:hypothetical protein